MITHADPETITQEATKEQQPKAETNHTKRLNNKHDRCPAFYDFRGDAGYCCETIKRVEIPEVGMMCFDNTGHYPGFITKVVIGETEQPYVHYQDFFTGKVTLQYLDEIILPPVEHQAAFRMRRDAATQRTEADGNPFLSLYREFSDFEDRLLALYKRLSRPNEPVEDVRDTASELRFQIDVAITGWERDIKCGTLRPVETNGAADDQTDHKSAL